MLIAYTHYPVRGIPAASLAVYVQLLELPQIVTYIEDALCTADLTFQYPLSHGATSTGSVAARLINIIRLNCFLTAVGL